MTHGGILGHVNPFLTTATQQKTGYRHTLTFTDKWLHYHVTFRFIFALEEDLGVNMSVNDVLTHITLSTVGHQALS